MTTPNSPDRDGAVQITTAMIYTEVRRLSDLLAPLATTQTLHEQRLEDHEQRLRAQEQRKYVSPTALYAALGLAFTAVSVLAAFLGLR